MSNISVSNSNETKLIRVSLATSNRIDQLSSLLTKKEGGYIPAGRIVHKAVEALERELAQSSAHFRYPLTPQQPTVTPLTPEETANLSNRLGAIPPKEGRDYQLVPANDLPLAPGTAIAQRKGFSSADRVNLAEFEIFWKTYPRKVGKAAAQKAWLRAKNRPNLDTVISALIWQMQHGDLSRAELQFIPHASTWINQERWADERTKPETQLDRDTRTVESAVEMAKKIDEENAAKRRGQR